MAVNSVRHSFLCKNKQQITANTNLLNQNKILRVYILLASQMGEKCMIKTFYKLKPGHLVKPLIHKIRVVYKKTKIGSVLSKERYVLVFTSKTQEYEKIEICL